jgi:hypothetical protein
MFNTIRTYRRMEERDYTGHSSLMQFSSIFFYTKQYGKSLSQGNGKGEKEYKKEMYTW